MMGDDIVRILRENIERHTKIKRNILRDSALPCVDQRLLRSNNMRETVGPSAVSVEI